MSFLDKNNILNDTYSNAGKASAELYNILYKENKIRQKEKEKKKYFREFFAPDEEWENSNTKILKQEDGYSFFKEINGVQAKKQREINKNKIKNYFKEYFENQTNSNEKKTESDNQYNQFNLSRIFPNKKEKIIKLEINNYSKKQNSPNKNIKKELSSPILNNDKYKYHNNHMKYLIKLKIKKSKNKYKIIKNNEPLYNPKTDCIYNRIIIGPNWKKISGRNKILFKETEHCVDKFYINIFDNINTTKNTFVELNKQTQRKGFPLSSNLRQRNEIKFIPMSADKKKQHKNKKNKKDKKPLISKSPFSRDKLDYKIKKMMGIKENYYIGYKSHMDKDLSHKKGKSVPDFGRCISRDYLYKLDKKLFIESNDDLNPNYNSVKEKAQGVIIHNEKSNSVKKSKRIKGIKSSELFNLTQNFENIYGHYLKVVPNFEKMSSRPMDKTLPSFMKGMCNRMIYYLNTDKSLKLNNYSNRDTYYNIYNNYHNTSKVKKTDESKSLMENIYDDNDDEIYNNEQKSKINEYINKSIKQTKVMKKEINATIKKINDLYHDYQKHS